MAAALGYTVVAFKRWVKDGLVPPPLYVDSVRGYGQYSHREAEEVARILHGHFQGNVYLTKKHESTITAIWQAIQRTRRA